MAINTSDVNCLDLRAVPITLRFETQDNNNILVCVPKPPDF